MNKTYNIAAIPGDGTGPEVVTRRQESAEC